MNEVVAHTILAAGILAGYIVLTALGHDANALLALLGGQALGAGTTAVARKTTGG